MYQDRRRREKRVRSRGPVHIVTKGKAGIPGTIYNVSLSGYCIETAIAFDAGIAVQVVGEGFSADGVVRYCQHHGQTFRVGIDLNPPEAA